MNWQLNGLIPTISVRNLDEAILFYQKLGFNLDWKWPQSKPSHASLLNGKHSFMITIHQGKGDIQRADLYFIVDNVGELHQHYQLLNLAVSDLFDTEYGMIDFSLEDPWGHHLVFGQAKESV